MGLFGSDMQVELVLAQPAFVAGQPVQARLRLGEPDDKVEGGHVELVCRNTYRYDTRDSDGDRVTRTRTDDIVVASAPIGSGGVLRAGEQALSLLVPPQAPGTSRGAVEWVLRAVVARKRAVDSKTEVPVMVLAPAAALLDWSQTPVGSPPECAMGIDVSSRVLRPADRVTGTLTLTPSQKVEARSVRVQLRRVRLDPDGNKEEERAAESVVCEDLELAPGATRSFSFDLAVPPDARPSFAAPHNRQHWLLEGVLDRPRAQDRVGYLEVLVHTG